MPASLSLGLPDLAKERQRLLLLDPLRLVERTCLFLLRSKHGLLCLLTYKPCVMKKGLWRYLTYKYVMRLLCLLPLLRHLRLLDHCLSRALWACFTSYTRSAWAC